MAPADDDAPWTRQLLVGIGALAGVSLLVGAVVGAVALGAAKLSGIEGAGSGPTRAASLYLPSVRPTTTPEVFPDPTGRPTSPTAEPTAEPSPTESKTPRRAITLQAFPGRVAPGERINLTGVYPSGEGARVQVQRFEGGWSDFPVDASVSGGIFNTYVITSRTGVQRFRVVDTRSQRASNEVRVRVG